MTQASIKLKHIRMHIAGTRIFIELRESLGHEKGNPESHPEKILRWFNSKISTSRLATCLVVLMTPPQCIFAWFPAKDVTRRSEKWVKRSSRKIGAFQRPMPQL